MQSWVTPLTQNPQKAVTRMNERGLGYDMHESLELAEAWLAPGTADRGAAAVVVPRRRQPTRA